MKLVAALTLMFSIAGVTLGLFPCLGWLNWIAVPFCVVPFTLGVIGLLTDKDASGRREASIVYLACVIVPILIGAGGALRCAIGGGVF